MPETARERAARQRSGVESFQATSKKLRTKATQSPLGPASKPKRRKAAPAKKVPKKAVPKVPKGGFGLTAKEIRALEAAAGKPSTKRRVFGLSSGDQ